MKHRSCLAIVATLSLVSLAALGTLGCARLKSKLLGSDAGVSTGVLPLGENALLKGFEGDVGIRFEAKGEPSMDLLLRMKGDKLRTSVPSQLTAAIGNKQGYALLHTAAKKVYFVSDPEKKVWFLDFERAAAMTGSQSDFARGQPAITNPKGGSPAAAVDQLQVVRTGRRSRVADIDCEDWEISSASKAEGRVLLCVAEAEGSAGFLRVPTTLLPGKYAFAAEMLDGKHFPLRFIAEQNGVEKTKITVTQLARKAVADAELEPPKSYPQLDFFALLFGGGGGGGLGGLLMPGLQGVPAGSYPKVAPGVRKTP